MLTKDSQLLVLLGEIHTMQSGCWKYVPGSDLWELFLYFYFVFCFMFDNVISQILALATMPNCCYPFQHDRFLFPWNYQPKHIFSTSCLIYTTLSQQRKASNTFFSSGMILYTKDPQILTSKTMFNKAPK